MGRPFEEKGTPSREKYEEGFENFKIGVLIQEARKQQNLNQEELAQKSDKPLIIFHVLRTMPVIFAFRHL